MAISVGEDAAAALRDRHRGDVIDSAHPSYDEARQLYNAMIPNGAARPKAPVA